MITAQPRERRPALRAAVPSALKVPNHLNPGQVRVIPPPRPRPRPPRPALITARPAGRRLPPPSPPGAGGSGRDRSDESPNTIRCRTASAALTRSSSADCRAISASRPARASRSSAAVRSQHSFASSAAARAARSDATSASEPAATATQHSKHHHQPQITHPTPACRPTRARGGERPPSPDFRILTPIRLPVIGQTCHRMHTGEPYHCLVMTELGRRVLIALRESISLRPLSDAERCLSIHLDRLLGCLGCTL